MMDLGGEDVIDLGLLCRGNVVFGGNTFMPFPD